MARGILSLLSKYRCAYGFRSISCTSPGLRVWRCLKTQQLGMSMTMSCSTTVNPYYYPHHGSVPILLSPRECIVQTRHYAKAAKKGGKQKKPKVELRDDEMMVVINPEKLRKQMQEIIDGLQQDFTKNLSLRTSTGVVDQLEVDFEGDTYPLNQLAQIVMKNPNLMIINVGAFPQAIPAVLTALRDSGMNINPQQEANMIYIPITKVTREHRESLAKSARMLCVKTKERLRDLQNRYIKECGKKKDGVSEDLIYNVKQTIQHRTEEFSQKAEHLMEVKQKELLGGK
ncbi:PREDICTED: ribosome-recycling factor, mitochondrial-like isoform X1 [Priapulus caudatus]|uniref:Ribosome-recycling factor, mitochondrial n=2 Tax=Priapulus caudatus TaxID=37621 RepID=A0ABM1DP89_PRICU|nr:PREDICTED: ribosome-recycling factor, mitochondrial-like isoform X1 [Priapulus caudatus]